MNIPAASALSSSGPSHSVESLRILLSDVKNRLQKRLAACYEQLLPVTLIERTIDEAAHLAWTTGWPHLFLPALAEEKVRAVAVAAAVAPGRRPRP